MGRRAGIWAIGGAVAATGALVASPATYTWLRKRAGLQQEDREHFEELLGEPDDAAPSDVREARLSLRARLAEAQELVADPGLGEPVTAATTVRRPERDDHEPMRRAVDEARARTLSKARAAAATDGDNGGEPVEDAPA